jgi:hypothetical protein
MRHLWIEVIMARKRCSPKEEKGGGGNRKPSIVGHKFQRGCRHKATVEGEGCLCRVLLGRSGRARGKGSMWHQWPLNRGCEGDGEGGPAHGIKQREGRLGRR